MEEQHLITPRIRAYLEGRLSLEEKMAFEEERKQDPELDQAVKSALLLTAGLQHTEHQDRRTELKDLLRQQRKVKTRRLWTSIALAASVLLLAGLMWYYMPGQQASPAELFAEYYEAPAAPETMGTAGDSLLRLGHAAYNRQAYGEAQQFYEDAVEAGLDLSQVPYLYLGIALLENESFEKAHASLTKARAQHPERAAWYLAMLSLRTGDVVTARGALEAIAGQEGHYYQGKATELLEEL